MRAVIEKATLILGSVEPSSESKTDTFIDEPAASSTPREAGKQTAAPNEADTPKSTKTTKKAGSKKRKGDSITRSATRSNKRLTGSDSTSAADCNSSAEITEIPAPTMDTTPQQQPTQAPPGDFSAFQRYMDNQFLTLNNQIGGLTTSVAAMSSNVKNMDSRVEKNSSDIAKIMKEMEDLKKGQHTVPGGTPDVSGAVQAAIGKEMIKYGQELDRIKAVAGVKSMNAENTNRTPGRNSDWKEVAFWRARRCLRVWPVKSRNGDLWGPVGDFLYGILGVEKEELPREAVEDIRKVYQAKRRAHRQAPTRQVHDEVVVMFRDTQTRDFVYSHAPNLARLRESSNAERAGVRQEIPDHLTGVFKTLERYGHQLRQVHGTEFRRSLKFDDVSMSLCLDYKLPEEDEWARVHYDEALEESQKLGHRTAGPSRPRLMSDPAPATSGTSLTSTRSSSTSSTSDIVLPQSSTLQRFAAGKSGWGNR